MPTGNDAAKENAAVNESTRKEATDTKIRQSSKSRGRENIVAIKLTSFDRPETSGSPGTNKKSVSKVDQGKAKSSQDKAVQMRQNSSTQRLQGDEDNDDDVRYTRVRVFVVL